MITDHTPETLRAFEADIADLFNSGQIRAPIHLSGGNEEALIGVFEHIKPSDWVATQWRSHYHCLLKGVPPERLKEDVVAGRSITLNYPEYRIISSAIVGGVLPIAMGIAAGMKWGHASAKVWAFVGDMTAMSGIYHECRRYADGHQLPIRFVIEDNGLSVCSFTQATWGQGTDVTPDLERRHLYRLSWPHSGAGVRVNF